MVDIDNPAAGPVDCPPPVPALLPAGMERRRPGRREYVDPALVLLLRRTPDLDATLPSFDVNEERLADRAPSRGIVIGILVSILLWIAGIAGLVAALS